MQNIRICIYDTIYSIIKTIKSICGKKYADYSTLTEYHIIDDIDTNNNKNNNISLNKNILSSISTQDVRNSQSKLFTKSHIYNTNSPNIYKPSETSNNIQAKRKPVRTKREPVRTKKDRIRPKRNLVQEKKKFAQIESK